MSLSMKFALKLAQILFCKGDGICFSKTGNTFANLFLELIVWHMLLSESYQQNSIYMAFNDFLTHHS